MPRAAEYVIKAFEHFGRNPHDLDPAINGIWNAFLRKADSPYDVLEWMDQAKCDLHNWGRGLESSFCWSMSCAAKEELAHGGQINSLWLARKTLEITGWHNNPYWFASEWLARERRREAADNQEFNAAVRDLVRACGGTSVRREPQTAFSADVFWKWRW